MQAPSLSFFYRSDFTHVPPAPFLPSGPMESISLFQYNGSCLFFSERVPSSFFGISPFGHGRLTDRFFFCDPSQGGRFSPFSLGDVSLFLSFFSLPPRFFFSPQYSNRALFSFSLRPGQHVFSDEALPTFFSLPSSNQSIFFFFSSWIRSQVPAFPSFPPWHDVFPPFGGCGRPSSSKTKLFFLPWRFPDFFFFFPRYDLPPPWKGSPCARDRVPSFFFFFFFFFDYTMACVFLSETIYSGSADMVPLFFSTPAPSEAKVKSLFSSPDRRPLDPRFPSFVLYAAHSEELSLFLHGAFRRTFSAVRHREPP